MVFWEFVAMEFDIRAPIGALFLLLGLLVGGYGLFSGTQIYRASLVGVNIDAIWGGVMAGFGLIMLALSAFRTRG
jgi:hypothetical protein